MSEVNGDNNLRSPDSQKIGPAVVLKSERFHLKLTESNDDSYPEFNYADLMAQRLREKSTVNGFNEDSDDTDVKKLAEKFEKKYGPNSSNSYYDKKSKWKNDDYADIGAGYDESDSFIDNTEAYDEIIPEDVTTFYGGFYVNFGNLEFKQLNGKKNKANGRRIISDTDSSDFEACKTQKDGSTTKKIKFDNEKSLLTKKNDVKKCDNKINTVDSIIKTENGVKLKPNKNKDPDKEIETISSDVTSDESAEDSSDDNQFSTTTIDSDSTQDEDLNDEISSLKLSENLKTAVLDLLGHKKEVAKMKHDDKKYKIIDKYLSVIYDESRSLNSDIRNKLYEKISDSLKIQQSELSRHSKMLLLIAQTDVLKKLVSKLKDAIADMMPKCQLQYNTEYNRNLAKSNNGDNTNSNIKLPKRKFIWTSQTTKILNEIVDIKRKKYQLRGTYKETFYNHIITFFKNEIVKLWPDGWMGINVILKHCKTLNQNRTESKSTNSSSAVIKSKTNSIVNTNTDTPSNNKTLEVTSTTPSMTASLPSGTTITTTSSTLPEVNTTSIPTSDSTSVTVTLVPKPKPVNTTATSSVIMKSKSPTTTKTSFTTITTPTAKENFPITSTPVSKFFKSAFPEISLRMQPITSAIEPTNLTCSTITTTMSSKLEPNTHQSNVAAQISPLDFRVIRESSIDKPTNLMDLSISKSIMSSSVCKNTKYLKQFEDAGNYQKLKMNLNNKYGGTEVPYMSPAVFQNNRLQNQQSHQSKQSTTTVVSSSTVVSSISVKTETPNISDDYQKVMNSLKELGQMQKSSSCSPSVSLSAFTNTKPTTVVPRSNSKPISTPSTTKSSGHNYNCSTITKINSDPKLSYLNQNQYLNKYHQIPSSTITHIDEYKRSNHVTYNCPSAPTSTKTGATKNSTSFIISNLLSRTSPMKDVIEEK